MASGMGAGFGASDFGGSFNRAQANVRANNADNRAERQQQAADKLNEYKIKEAQRVDSSNQTIFDYNEKVKQLEEEAKANKQKVVGGEAKQILKRSVTTTSDTGAKDTVRAVNNSPELLELLQAQKGDIDYFEPSSEAHQMGLTKYLAQNGVDTSKMTPEQTKSLYDKVSKSGSGFMYKGQYVDGYALAETMGALNDATTEELDNYEKQKSSIFNSLPKDEEDTANTQPKATPQQSATEPVASKTPSTEMPADAPLASKDTVEATTANGTTVKATETNVAPDGSVATISNPNPNPKIPPHVQMAMDYVGKKSSFGTKDPLSAMGKFVKDYVGQGLGTEEEGFEAWMEMEDKKKASGSVSNLEKMTTYLEGRVDPMTGKQYTKARALEKAQQLQKGGTQAQYAEFEAALRAEKDPVKRQAIKDMMYSMGYGKKDTADEKGLREREARRQVTVANQNLFYKPSKVDSQTLATLASVERNNIKDMDNTESTAIKEKKKEMSNRHLTINSVDNLVTDFKTGKIDNYERGPIANIKADVVGVLGKDYVTDDMWAKAEAKMQGDTRTGMLLANFLRSTSGLTVSDEERKFLTSVMVGGNWHSEDELLSRITEFRNQVAYENDVIGNDIWNDAPESAIKYRQYNVKPSSGKEQPAPSVSPKQQKATSQAEASKLLGADVVTPASTTRQSRSGGHGARRQTSVTPKSNKDKYTGKAGWEKAKSVKDGKIYWINRTTRQKEEII